MCIPILSGCWDYREINELSIVSGLAIDSDSAGKGYSLTAEIVDFGVAGKENKIQSKRIQADGKTIFDAVRNIIKLSAKRLYWSHANIVIISQDIARKGILPVVDVFHRVRETRISTHILISKTKTARELLSQESIATNIRSMEIKEMMINENNLLGKSPNVDLRDFINMLSEEGQSPVLPAVGVVINDGYRTSELSGMAIFRGDKFVGFLNEEDTKFFMFVKNQIKDTLLSLDENLKGDHKDVTLEIYENKTKEKAVNVNGKLSVIIDINAVASVGELGIRNDLIDESGCEILKREAVTTLKSNVENVIRKVKQEYGLDIFGFGTTIKREMPTVWKTMSSNWNNTFRNLDVKVYVNIEIKGSGVSSKPIKIGE